MMHLESSPLSANVSRQTLYQLRSLTQPAIFNSSLSSGLDTISFSKHLNSKPHFGADVDHTPGGTAPGGDPPEEPGRSKKSLPADGDENATYLEKEWHESMSKQAKAARAYMLADEQLVAADARQDPNIQHYKTEKKIAHQEKSRTTGAFHQAKNAYYAYKDGRADQDLLARLNNRKAALTLGLPVTPSHSTTNLHNMTRDDFRAQRAEAVTQLTTAQNRVNDDHYHDLFSTWWNHLSQLTTKPKKK